MLVAILHAVHFFARHGVCGNELDVGAKHVLNIVHDAALYAGHVGKHGARLQELLVLGNPLLEHGGVQAEHHCIGVGNNGRLNGGISFVDDAIFQGVINGLLVDVDGCHVKTQALECPRVAAANQAQAHNEYAFFANPLHVHPPNKDQRPAASGVRNNRGSSCPRLAHR